MKDFIFTAQLEERVLGCFTEEAAPSAAFYVLLSCWRDSAVLHLFAVRCTSQ